MLELSGFTGTTQWPRLGMLFPNFLLTDGSLYLAQEAEAFWLMEAIASYQDNPKIKGCPMCQEIQFWELETFQNSGVLKCYRDEGDLVLEQKIPFTDFPLPKIKLYCQSSGSNWVIMLPSEY